MDDIDYETIRFNVNESQSRHPLWMTEAHFIYHLYRDAEGVLSCHKDTSGEPVCSPRHLANLCMNKLVCDPGRVFGHMKARAMPGGIYPALLSEAIFQRELHTINFLVSTWPTTVLDLQSAMPVEDLSDDEILTTPVEEKDGLTILDCVVYALLALRPQSNLKMINFSGFTDRKLSRELSRLPLLWMNPDDRTVDRIHDILVRTIDISREKVQKYLNRFNLIYANMDPYIKHGNQFEPVTIILDCKITLDDVPIGLGLQYETPFRFGCKRVWMEPIPEISLPMTGINQVLELRDLTQVEYSDPHICHDMDKLGALMEGLHLLPHLQALSFPNTIHSDGHENAVKYFASGIGKLPMLRKLNLASCNLREQLDTILSELTQDITYLNLRDCRLCDDDIVNIRLWNNVTGLKELNLSRNNLKTSHLAVGDILQAVPTIGCFSVSYCSLSNSQLETIAQKCIDLKNLKLLGLQSFTPPVMEDMESLLQICSLIDSLQKCYILPDAFAFPGGNSAFRYENRMLFTANCETFLQQIGRPDIDLE
ncbi:Leucine-rich repeat-containing protein 14 [Mizuhopecten yessoensis]|uniref:Leucine-rich repeat-containing protein 14 n=2 Tax=Mizuhopecten yessoensis TaxID=6573 RepID=A0A210R2X8_MIZYE|nr:Leucine-rich repeat-containing protein 14 [Mizuhopecten yessoensis]